MEMKKKNFQSSENLRKKNVRKLEEVALKRITSEISDDLLVSFREATPCSFRFFFDLLSGSFIYRWQLRSPFGKKKSDADATTP